MNSSIGPHWPDEQRAHRTVRAYSVVGGVPDVGLGNL